MTDRRTASDVFPETILNLREMPEYDAVNYVYRTYSPILTAILAKRMQTTRDNDSVQEIIQRFVAEKLLANPAEHRVGFVERWDPTRGRFRCFLLRSFDNFVRTAYRRQKRRREVPVADDFDAAHPDGSIPLSLQGVAWVHAVFCIALARFEADCKHPDFEIFRLRDVQPRLTLGANAASYAALESRFGLSSGQISGILRRTRDDFDRQLFAVIREHFGYDNQDDAQQDFRLAKKVLDAKDYATEMAQLLEQLGPWETTRFDSRQAASAPVDATQFNLTQIPVACPTDEPQLSLLTLLNCRLTRMSIDATGEISAAAAKLPPNAQTLAQLFDQFLEIGSNSERPTLASLKQLKDAFAANRDSLRERDWHAIYCALNAAVVGFGDRAIGEFTRNSKQQVLRNLRKLNKLPVLLPSLRRLIAEASESLELN